MDRTLYLTESGRNTQVRRDGPSIWITRDNKSGQRIPARLVGRVVIIGNIMLDSGTVTLFSENDIPVIFMNRGAEEVAVTMPYSHRLPVHHHDQKAIFTSADKLACYESWARNWSLTVELSVLRRLYPLFKGQLPFKIADSDYQEVVAYLKPQDEQKWDIVRRFTNNLFRGLIIEQLILKELDPHMGILHRQHAFGLALDICHILSAEQDMQCLQFFRSASIEKPALDTKYRVQNVTDSVVRNIVHRFENRRSEINKLVGYVLNELLQLMRQVGR